MEYKTLTLNKSKIDDFAEERNKALEKSKSEWVLFLDSDELLSPALEDEIKELVPDENINGYYIPRIGVVEERILRLARKGTGKWERCVHEVWKVKGEIGFLKNPIIHLDENSVSDMLRKANFYSTLHAKANKLEGKKSNMFKIMFFPIFKFFQTLIVKKAYKKGLRGFVFSIIQSFQSFLSWTKLYFLSI